MLKEFRLVILAGLITCFQPLTAQKALTQRADSLYHIGVVLETKYGDSIKSIADEILKISSLSKYESGIVKAKILAAVYYAGRFKLDTAAVLLTACENFFTTNTWAVDSEDHGRVSYYKGEILYRKMALDEAEAYARHAMAVFKNIENEFMVGEVYSQLANIEVLRQNDPKVLDYFTKAYEAKLHARAEEGKLRKELSGIAFIYLKMGQFSRAEEYGRKALKIDLKAENPVNIVAGYNLMANIKFSLDQPDSALHYYTLSRGVAERSGNQMMIATTIFHTADLYTKLNRFVESNRLILPMLHNAKSSRSMMTEMVRAQCAYNYLKLKKYDSAIYLARISYQAYLRNSRKERVSEMAKILSESFQAKNRNDSAMHYLTVHYTLKDSLYSQENQRKLSSLYAEIETIGKQREIERLEKEQLIHTAQNRFLLLWLVLGGLSFAFILASIILFYHNQKKKHLLEKFQLEQELQSKNRNLHDQALKMIHMNNGLEEVEQALRKIRSEATIPSKEVLQVLSTLQINKSLEKEWDNFNDYFGSVHSGFFERLNKQFPATTIMEKRLAALIKMNLTNNEIAGILNIESSSVKMAKYRLKKKFGLADEQDIGHFFQAF
jgi:tetratricopeptide (TPR) repeat protein